METRGLGRRWLKFNLVGAIGIVVQLAALAALTRLLRMNYLIATALAVEAAVLHNFVWHERFTWADRSSVTQRQMLGRLLRFNLTTGLVSIAGNLGLMWVLAGRLDLPYLLANAIAIAACSIANFLLSHTIVFNTPQRGGQVCSSESRSSPERCNA